MNNPPQIMKWVEFMAKIQDRTEIEAIYLYYEYSKLFKMNAPAKIQAFIKRWHT